MKGFPDHQLVQADRELKMLAFQIERARDEVRTYLLALDLGPAAADRNILHRTTVLQIQLRGLAPRVAGIETLTRQLSKRAHKGRGTPSSAFGRIGQIKGQSLPEAQQALEKLEAELRTLALRLQHRFQDPLRTAGPFTGGAFEILNVVLELLALVLKVRQEDKARLEDRSGKKDRLRLEDKGR